MRLVGTGSMALAQIVDRLPAAPMIAVCQTPYTSARMCKVKMRESGAAHLASRVTHYASKLVDQKDRQNMSLSIIAPRVTLESCA